MQNPLARQMGKICRDLDIKLLLASLVLNQRNLRQDSRLRRKTALKWDSGCPSFGCGDRRKKNMNNSGDTTIIRRTMDTDKEADSYPMLAHLPHGLDAESETAVAGILTGEW